MQRFLPLRWFWTLPAVALAALVAGWWSGYWTLGAGAALTALCGLAVVAPGRKRIDADESSDAAPAKVFESRPVFAEGRKREQKSSLVEEMIAQGRVALLLRPQVAASLSARERGQAQIALDDTMAMVPEGQVAMRPRCTESWDGERVAHAERLVRVEGFFLDRTVVTNRQYAEFVAAGGYEQMSLWDEAMWPAVLTFVDRTGQPGPRLWENGQFPSGQEEYPVVGVSWYEASAYARWAGKRLATDAEWVKAASWPVIAEGAKPRQRRYPWGDAMDRRLANIWGSGFDGPIAADALPSGASANGVLQLVGNVWEWTSTPFGAWEPPQRKLETESPLKSIRGGAFDTYFETQAHCQFQSGESPLARKHNIGFRCAVGFCDVADGSEEENPDSNETQGEEALEEVTA